MPINPDRKDWTWVLERRCEQCGFDSSKFPRQHVAERIRANARAWRDVLDGSSSLTTRPSDDRWSVLEYACHVRDVFRIYDERLRLMLTEDGPTFPNWDQDATAVDDRYNEQDPTTVAAEIGAAAARLADSFDEVEGAAWVRTATRSDGAHFTVDTFARYMVHDPVHHLHDVGAIEK